MIRLQVHQVDTTVNIDRGGASIKFEASDERSAWTCSIDFAGPCSLKSSEVLVVEQAIRERRRVVLTLALEEPGGAL